VGPGKLDIVCPYSGGQAQITITEIGRPSTTKKVAGMAISSRTPEGLPHRCPICGAVALVEPAWPRGDAVCPACGSWLLYLRDHIPNLDERLQELELHGDSMGYRRTGDGT
jgi:hypothetical protein